MSTSITGRATIFGFQGDLTYGTIAANVDQAFINGDLSADAELKDMWRDGTGEVRGLSLRDLRRKFTVDFFPLGGTSANNTLAKAAAATDLPPIPSKITLSNVKDAFGTALPSIDGDWVFHGGGSISYSDGQAKLKLPLEEFTTSPATATDLTTPVS